MPKQSATASFDPKRRWPQEVVGSGPPSAFDCEAWADEHPCPVLDLR